MKASPDFHASNACCSSQTVHEMSGNKEEGRKRVTIASRGKIRIVATLTVDIVLIRLAFATLNATHHAEEFEAVKQT